MPVLGYGRSDRATALRPNGLPPSEPAPADAAPTSSSNPNSSGSSGETPPYSPSTLLNRFTLWRPSNEAVNPSNKRSLSSSGSESGPNAPNPAKPASSTATKPATNAKPPPLPANPANSSNSSTPGPNSGPVPSLRPPPSRIPANPRLSPHPPTASPNTASATPINVADYCLGTPKKVGQSHAGAVELFLCTQENAVFLPPLAKKSHRRRHHRHSNRADFDPNAPSATHTEGFVNVNGDDPTLTRSATRDSDFLDPSSANDDLANEGSANEGSANEGSANEGTDSVNTDSVNTDRFSGERNSSDQNSSDDARQELGPHETLTSNVYGSLNLHSGGVLEDLASSCSTLRGSVLMKLSKPTKIKEVGVNFFCLSRTLWNLLSQSSVLADSTLPNNAQVEDTAYLGIHHWDFVPLEQFGSAQSQYDKGSGGQSSTLIGQDLYGADVAVFKDQPQQLQHRKFSRIYNSQACRVRGGPAHPMPVFGPLKTRPRKLKPNSVNSDGVIFPAGSYVYNFALLIDEKTPGSIHVPNGQVKFVLSARVVRAGAFNMNVSGQMEVDVVRSPPDASSEGAMYGLMNDAILLSRVWNDRFVYSLEIDRRNLTMDVPTRMTLSVLPLNLQTNADVRLHQVQVYVLETVTYIYSLDPSIRYVDPDLKLLLFQKDAESGNANEGNLLQERDVTTIQTKLTMVSEHHPQPHRAAQQPFQRGRYGEMRFIEPDVKGPYITVRHRLMLVMRVSRPSVDGSRSHYEVKIDTPITVQSRHCVSDNIRLPTYIHSEVGRSASPNAPANQRASELPPSFDDAMSHELLGPSGTDSLPRRGHKAVHDGP